MGNKFLKLFVSIIIFLITDVYKRQERLEQIIAKERPDALLPNLGGQSGLNLCSELQNADVLDKYNAVSYTHLA